MATSHLIDTNILLRASRRDDPDYADVIGALATSSEAGAILYYTLLNMAEFWNVATRPVARNGFGLAVADTDRIVRDLEAGMTLLPDDRFVYQEWRRLVVEHGVAGTKAHDARLVAAMLVHGVTHLLTLNTDDFNRYRAITAVHPRIIAKSSR